MARQQVWLRAMLWLLAAAAATGVLTVLFSPPDAAWRVVGTLALGAFASAAMWVGSLLAQRPATRWAGLFLTRAGLLVFFGILLLIWEVLPNSVAESLAMSLAAWTGAAIWTTLALAFIHRPRLAIAARAAILLAATALPFWLIIIWNWGLAGYSWPRWADELNEATWAVVLFGMAVVALLLDYTARRWWMWLGIAAAVVGCGMWQAHIWFLLQSQTGLGECIASLAVLLAYVSVVRLIPLRPAYRWIQVSAIAAAGVTTLCIDAGIVLDKSGADSEIALRFAGAGAIATACAALATMVAWLLGRRDVAPQELSAITQISLVCPGCQKRGTFSVGTSRCPHCRLEFDMHIREPRCPACNYLVYMLTSDRCPECGNLLARG